MKPKIKVFVGVDPAAVLRSDLVTVIPPKYKQAIKTTRPTLIHQPHKKGR